MDKKTFSLKISLEDLKGMLLEEEYNEFIQQQQDHHKYIYMCCWFDTKRHTRPHTKMFYENAEDTHWIFNTPDWFNDLVRIEYIKVCPHSPEYSSAVHNSNKNKTENKDEDKPASNSILLSKS
jgi:hypothetical protein